MYCLEIVELHQQLSETWTLLEPYHTDQNIHGAGEAAKNIKEEIFKCSSKKLNWKGTDIRERERVHLHLPD